MNVKPALICFAATLLTSPLLARHASQWGDLHAGPHAVGYKTIVTEDPTRRYFGGGRPLQLYVWYPASQTAKGKPMTYGEYFEDAAHDWGNNPADVARLRKWYADSFQSGSMNPSFPGKIDKERFARILATPIPVTRNAPAAPGPFPILLHMHSSGVLHQSLTLEYLASHGYIILSASAYSSGPAFYGRGEEGPNALLHLTEDLALMLGHAKQLAGADATRVGMVGMWAQVGLSLQLRGMPLKAIACLDCLGYAQALQALPYYDPKNIRIPLLELINSEYEDEDTGQQKTFLDTFVSADRYIGRFKSLRHAEFYPFPKLVGLQPEQTWSNYATILSLTEQFLDQVLKKDVAHGDLGSSFAQLASFRHSPAGEATPSEGEFLTWIRYGDMARAKAAFDRDKTIAAANKLFFTAIMLARDEEAHAAEVVDMFASAFPADPRGQRLFSYLGNKLQSSGHATQAVALYARFAQRFPDSPYAYHGLSGAHVAAGDRSAAQAAARKMLELLERLELPAEEEEKMRRSVRELE